MSPVEFSPQSASSANFGQSEAANAKDADIEPVAPTPSAKAATLDNRIVDFLVLMPHRCRAIRSRSREIKVKNPARTRLTATSQNSSDSRYPHHQNWHIQTAGFPNASIFIVSQPKEGSKHRCARSGEKPALAQSSPLLQARACISSGCASRNCWRNADYNDAYSMASATSQEFRGPEKESWELPVVQLHIQVSFATRRNDDRYKSTTT
ncbi:hypothetical protein V1279_006292 [Bradyrhizobium sp. AZCC 1610]